MLDNERMKILQGSYKGCYLQLRKNYLNFLQHSMSQDSLVGTTVGTLSIKERISCASTVTSSSDLSQHTKSSKGSRKSGVNTFQPMNLNQAFMPMHDFEEYRKFDPAPNLLAYTLQKGRIIAPLSVLDFLL
jgi:hypothetical protein